MASLPRLGLLQLSTLRLAQLPLFVFVPKQFSLIRDGQLLALLVRPLVFLVQLSEQQLPPQHVLGFETPLPLVLWQFADSLQDFSLYLGITLGP